MIIEHIFLLNISEDIPQASSESVTGYGDGTSVLRLADVSLENDPSSSSSTLHPVVRRLPFISKDNLASKV
jgi:hypothetical protein